MMPVIASRASRGGLNLDSDSDPTEDPGGTYGPADDVTSESNRPFLFCVVVGISIMVRASTFRRLSLPLKAGVQLSRRVHGSGQNKAPLSPMPQAKETIELKANIQHIVKEKKERRQPDFIINSVPPEHSGSAWLRTKRVDEKVLFGEESLEGGYKQFREDIRSIVPDARVFTDPLRTLTYGTDASFYRLVPKIVVKVHDEAEMIRLIKVARKNKTPITFRAGGTSLSGQAVTDSILLKLGHTWRYRKIEDSGKTITVEPGWILGTTLVGIFFLIEFQYRFGRTSKSHACALRSETRPGSILD